MATPADMLDWGADYIETKGWWDGQISKDHGSPTEGAGSCLVLSLTQGAPEAGDLHRVFSDPMPWDETIEYLHHYLFDGAEADGCERLYQWNDSHTGPEVIEMMRKAAQDWRNDHP